MKVSKWIVPILIVALTAAGLGIAQLFAIPTVEIVGENADVPQNVAMVTLIIPGVRCKDTAMSAASNVEDIAGVIKFVAFASHNRVEITYDQHLTGPESLIEAIEGPVYDAESGEFLFGVFVVSKTIKN